MSNTPKRGLTQEQEDCADFCRRRDEDDGPCPHEISDFCERCPLRGQPPGPYTYCTYCPHESEGETKEKA